MGGCACGGRVGGVRAAPGMCWWGVSPRNASHTPRPAYGRGMWRGLRVMCGWGSWEGWGRGGENLWGVF